MSTEYESLKDVALKCMGNIKFDGDANNVFKTPRVQEALGEVMTLTIKALERITKYYSKNKISECRFMAFVIFCSFEIQNVSS